MSVVQLSRSAVAVPARDRELDRLRAEFDRRHCVKLPGLVDAEALAYIQREFGRAVFADRMHEKIAFELCMGENPALHLLNFLVNDVRLFEVIQRITGCGRIGAFIGRVYRMASGMGHYDSWHSDLVDHRMIGMSVNLSARPYAGGVFELRERESETVVAQAPNTGAGDAILFRIAKHVEHRVTDVEGTVPKTAYAGWFVSEPDFLSLLSRTGVIESSATAE